MSSGAAAKPFFCYMCERTVSITVAPTTVPSCPLCQEGFLEDCDASNSPNPNLSASIDVPQNPSSVPDPNTYNPVNYLRNLMQSLHSGGARTDFQPIPSSVFESRGAAPASPDPNAYNPMDYLRNLMQTLHSGGPRMDVPQIPGCGDGGQSST